MTVRGVPIIAVLVALGLGAEPVGRAAPGHVGVAQVDRSILVTVLDAAGAPLRDLATADFAVREDGVARAVTDAHLATEPLHVSLLYDTTQPAMGVQAPVRDLRAGLAAFVTSVLTATPESRIALVEFGGAAQKTLNFTSKAADLDRAIRRVFPGQRAGAVLLEALVDAAKDLAKAESPRRAIVSVDLTSPEMSQTQPRTVAEAVQKSGASYWAVSIQRVSDAASSQAGVQPNDPLGPIRDVILQNLPQATGGVRLTAVSASALEVLLRRVAGGLTAQYVVTYSRPADATPARLVQPVVARGSKVLLGQWMR